MHQGKMHVWANWMDVFYIWDKSIPFDWYYVLARWDYLHHGLASFLLVISVHSNVNARQVVRKGNSLI